MPSVSLEHAKSLLTPNLRPLGRTLAKLLADDDDTREQGYDELDRLRRALAAEDAVALVRLATEVSFPPSSDDPQHELLFPLVESPHAKALAPLRAAYPRVSERAKCAVLAAIAAIGTRPAAEAFMACVREGWPKQVYRRVFTEAQKLAPHAQVMFPELVLRAGPHLGAVTDVLLRALTADKLDPTKLDLEPLAPLAKTSLAALLPKAKRAEKPSGTAWRFSERHGELREQLGAWIDLAGHLRAPALVPLLVEASALRDPLLAGLAAVALLRRERRVGAAVWERVAADPETRAQLYEALADLDALAHFPARWRTWEAFACAEMVTWLTHPAELGAIPEAIELVQRLTTGKQALYVWKFKDGKRWCAGVSGPYAEKGAPRPLHAPATFSMFEAAASKTPEAHAKAILALLAKRR